MAKHSTLDRQKHSAIEGPPSIHSGPLRKGKRQKGLTLMELMMTIAIIGILASVAIPSGVSWRRNAQFNSAVREVKANMERMRLFAVRNNTQSDLVFVDNANTFTTVRRTRLAGGVLNPVNQVHQLDAGITLTSTFLGDRLSFNNRGLANPGTLTVNGPSGLTSDIVVVITGNSQVQ